ncbi:MAG: SpoIIE family protein phosphatase [Lachnospiraceae bacterium]|nr:SpoIIE family protein phosphatase [Lachnospiraceae bacterium]
MKSALSYIKNKNLIFVVVTAVTLMFTAAVFSCSLVMIRTISKMAENLVGDMLQMEAERCVSCIDDYECLPWLLDFWSTNADDMITDYNELYKLESRLADFGDTDLLIDRANVTEERLNELEVEEQKVFADYCFLSCRLEVDTGKNARVPITTKCIRITDDSEFLFFSDINSEYEEDAGAGNILISCPLDKDLSEYYKTAEQNAVSGEKTAAFRTKGAEDKLVYCIPVIMDGNTVCLFTSSADSTLVRTTVLNIVKRILPGCIFMIILVAVILVLILRKSVVRPAVLLKNALQEYSETKRSGDIPKNLGGLTEERNEIGLLAAGFNDLAISIDSYVEEIRTNAAEKERMLSELNTAREIQMSQLPSDFPAFPERSDFDLYAIMDPALEVGGDFYDFFFLNDDHLVLVIGDVSDKGIPAALMMMVCKAYIRGAVGREESLAAAMEYVNKLICEKNSLGMFVTVWIAVLELSTGKGTAVNAGHEKPVIRRSGGSFEFVVNEHNLALGAWENEEYGERSFTLGKGDSVFVYSDGVPEANNISGELFGPKRMLEALNKVPDLTPEEKIKDMQNTIEEYVGEAKQFDDITMLMFTKKA